MTTAPSAVMYQVKRGDTLTSIAKFFGVSAAVLTAANHLGNGDRLTVGQVLSRTLYAPLVAGGRRTTTVTDLRTAVLLPAAEPWR